MKRQSFPIAQAVILACVWPLKPGAGSSADTITLDPGRPEQRPHYSCLGAPEYLVMCAAKWIQLVHDGKPSNSRSTYWYAAEFQGFVDGVAHMSINKYWCPRIIESNDQIYTTVGEYLVQRQNRLPKDENATKVVIAALSPSAPCKHAESE